MYVTLILLLSLLGLEVRVGGGNLIPLNTIWIDHVLTHMHIYWVGYVSMLGGINLKIVYSRATSVVWISSAKYTANIFNVIFTLCTCVPLSTVTARMVVQVQTSKWKVDLQFFYCNFYVGLYMANICKVYTFYMCPVSTVFSLRIFAVWRKPNKGKKRTTTGLVSFCLTLKQLQLYCFIPFDS